MKSDCQTEVRPVLKGYSHKDKCYYLYQPPCKQWSCPACAANSRIRWSMRIGEGIAFYRLLGLKDWRFVTITSSPKLKTRDQCLYVLPKAWSKLSTRMRRTYNGMKYCLIPELHKNGRVHMHMIASHGIDQRWLKNNAVACGFGYKDESDPIEDTVQAIMYVTKYLAKSTGIHAWPKGLRRIRTTQKWPNLEDNSDFEREDIRWSYYQSYESEGVGYLALMLEERLKTIVRVL